MAQKEKKGMRLLEADIPGQKEYSWLMHMVTALIACAVFVLIFTELTGFTKLYAPYTALFTGCVLCMIYGILEKRKRTSLFFPGILIVLLALVLLFRIEILEGACLLYNQIGDIWTTNTGKVLPELSMQTGGEESKSLLLFSVVIGGLISFLCCLLASGFPALLSVFLPGCLLAGMVLLKQEFIFVKILLVFGSGVFLLLYHGWEKRKSPFAVLAGWGVFAVLALLFIPVAGLKGVENWTARFSEEVHITAHEKKYETEYTTLPEGDFTTYTGVGEEGQAALVVTADNPEEMYLKGFAGATFEDGVWSSLNTEVLAQQKELLYWLNVNEFNPNAQFGAAYSFLEEAEKAEAGTVTVQNVGACSQYLYVPFSVSSGAFLQAENLNVDSLTTDGERVYTFTNLPDTKEAIQKVIENLKDTGAEAALHYRKAESAYRAFVQEHYLQIPEDVMDTLKEEWDVAAAPFGQVEELTPQQAQESVLAFLEMCFTEEGTTTEIMLPLTMAQGTSFQYATTAVLTLRYFGIPARYAEGYIITDGMAKKADSGTSIEVTSDQAGAWVEVYQDGIGWIPMALTPGMEELAAQENTIVKDQQKEDPEPEEEETPKEEPEPDGGYMVSISKAIKKNIGWILLGLLLILLLLVIRRKVLVGRKMKKFHGEDKKDAIGWIFADAALMLEKMGLARGKGSMDALCKPIEERFGEEYGAAYQTMVALNARALFSSRELTEEQRESALDFRLETLKHLKSNIKWHRRMWMQWIKCLY